MTAHFTLRRTAALALISTLAACAGVPERNLALEELHQRSTAAQADPQLLRLAPAEWQAAEAALRAADQSAQSGAPLSTVNHAAYLGAQRLTLAKEAASARAAQEEVAGAAAQRDRQRLASRTQEADQARLQLGAVQQQSAQQQQALVAAGTAVQLQQSQVQQGERRVADLESQLRDLNARQTERGLVLTLDDVLFDTGQSRLLSPATPKIERIADFLKANPLRTASVEGYTDSVGGSQANQALSERRAEAVTRVLLTLGVPAGQLSTRAYGEEQPVASNDSPSGRQMNRRVEIVIAPQPGNVSQK